jgi:hypothetical protein
VRRKTGGLQDEIANQRKSQATPREDPAKDVLEAKVPGKCVLGANKSLVVGHGDERTLLDQKVRRLQRGIEPLAPGTIGTSHLLIKHEVEVCRSIIEQSLLRLLDEALEDTIASRTLLQDNVLRR